MVICAGLLSSLGKHKQAGAGLARMDEVIIAASAGLGILIANICRF